MTEEMFLSLKAGDEVVSTKEVTGGSFTYGKTYKIREKPIENHSLTVEHDDEMDTTNGWSREYFEPVVMNSYELYEKLNMKVF